MDTIKEEIRRRCLAARRALAPEQVLEKSAAIYQHLQQLPLFQQASAVLTYVDSKDNEVQTRPLICQLLQNATPVFVPISEKGGQLRWSQLHNYDDLVPSRFGILEPRPERRTFPPLPTDAVCLTPGIAFSPRGDRIGYGGGYFDRFPRTFQRKKYRSGL